MEQMTTKGIMDIFSKGGVVAALLAIVFYFGNIFVNNIADIQKELAGIKIELVKIQTSIITEQHIEKLIDDKIRLVEMKYHPGNN